MRRTSGWSIPLDCAWPSAISYLDHSAALEPDRRSTQATENGVFPNRRKLMLAALAAAMPSLGRSDPATRRSGSP